MVCAGVVLLASLAAGAVVAAGVAVCGARFTVWPELVLEAGELWAAAKGQQMAMINDDAKNHRTTGDFICKTELLGKHLWLLNCMFWPW